MYIYKLQNKYNAYPNCIEYITYTRNMLDDIWYRNLLFNYTFPPSDYNRSINNNNSNYNSDIEFNEDNEEEEEDNEEEEKDESDKVDTIFTFRQLKYLIDTKKEHINNISNEVLTSGVCIDDILRYCIIPYI